MIINIFLLLILDDTQLPKRYVTRSIQLTHFGCNILSKMVKYEV
jgi:hypothetical protein